MRESGGQLGKIQMCVVNDCPDECGCMNSEEPRVPFLSHSFCVSSRPMIDGATIRRPFSKTLTHRRNQKFPTLLFLALGTIYHHQPFVHPPLVISSETARAVSPISIPRRCLSTITISSASTELVLLKTSRRHTRKRWVIALSFINVVYCFVLKASMFRSRL